MGIPRVRRLTATIPEEVFAILSDNSILARDFDNWLIEAILEKLKKEGKV